MLSRGARVVRLITDPQAIRPAVDRRVARARKSLVTAWRWSTLPPEARRALFIFGSQRSGTSILLEILDRAPEITTFGEGTNRALRKHRLRAPEVVESLVRRGPAPVTAMKPICDSHLADVILDQHQGSKAIWIWRNHHDVARSGLVRWGDHQADVIASIRSGRLSDVGWRGERIPRSVLEDIRSVPMRTPWDGAVLMWYLRTSFFFTLGLDVDERVLAVNYDRMLVSAEQTVSAVFDHIGVAVPCDAHTLLRGSGQPRPQPEELSDEVHELAMVLETRLGAHEAPVEAADR